MLSACLIVKNEENCLARCLASLENIADELIVLDTGSLDQTMDIARSFGARLVEWRPKGAFSFAEARNACQQYATEPWVLCIDADEYFEDGSLLRSELENTTPSVGGIYLPRRNHYISSRGAYDLDVRLNLRIVRNHPAIFWRGAIHERIVEQVETSGFTTQCSHVLLEHDVLQHSRDILERKQASYLQRILSELDKDASNGWMHMQAGKTWQFLNDYARARPYFEKAIQSEDPYAQHLALCYLALLTAPERNPKVGLRLLEKHAPKWQESSLFWFVRGELELLSDRPDVALSCYERMRCVGEPSPAPLFPADKQFTPAMRAERFGSCWAAMGNTEKARTFFEQSLDEPGVASKGYYALALLALKEANKPEALDYLTKTLQLSPAWTEVQHVLNALFPPS